MIAVRLPGLAQVMQAAFLNFIYLDVLMTEKWFLPLIYGDSDSGDGDDDGPIND